MLNMPVSYTHLDVYKRQHLHYDLTFWQIPICHAEVPSFDVFTLLVMSVSVMSTRKHTIFLGALFRSTCSTESLAKVLRLFELG